MTDLLAGPAVEETGRARVRHEVARRFTFERQFAPGNTPMGRSVTVRGGRKRVALALFEGGTGRGLETVERAMLYGASPKVGKGRVVKIRDPAGVRSIGGAGSRTAVRNRKLSGTEPMATHANEEEGTHRGNYEPLQPTIIGPEISDDLPGVEDGCEAGRNKPRGPGV